MDEWDKPLERTTRDYTAHRVSIALKPLRTNGAMRCYIAISKSLLEALGIPKRATLTPSKDGRKLKIEFAPNGVFAVTRGNSGGKTGSGQGAGRICFAPFGSAPSGYEICALECEILSKSAKELIITLPVNEWAKMVKEAAE